MVKEKLLEPDWDKIPTLQMGRLRPRRAKLAC